MIKGIAFDMDGLMFDTERLVIRAWDWCALYINDDSERFNHLRNNQSRIKI